MEYEILSSLGGIMNIFGFHFTCYDRSESAGELLQHVNGPSQPAESESLEVGDQQV